MFYIYVLKSEQDEKLYIGYTNDLKKRIAEHNTRKNFSTRSRGKFELIYYEAYKSEKDARLREKMLKYFGSAYSKLKLRLTDSLL